MSSKSRCVKKATRTNICQRFLYLEEMIPEAEPQDRQHENTSWKSSATRVQDTSVFSRLVLLTIVDITRRPHQLKLVLLRLISLTTLLTVCNGWTSANATDIVGLFGEDFSPEEKRRELPCLHRPFMGIITDLLISSGAYVWRDAARDATHERREQKSWRCKGKVFIADEVDMNGIKETLAMMFDDYPGRAGEPIGGNVLAQPRSSISLECSSSVLELVPGTVSRSLGVTHIALI
jgi:hypothetical protein